jgi:hypothetical protein
MERAQCQFVQLIAYYISNDVISSFCEIFAPGHINAYWHCSYCFCLRYLTYYYNKLK